MAHIPKVDEFSFVLAAGVLFLMILMFAWGTPRESKPVVLNDHFELSAAAGSKTTFNFEVRGSPQLTGINLTAQGEIARWITFNKNNFDVGSQPITVTATIEVPEDQEEGVYNGRVRLDGPGGTDTFSISLRVTGEIIETAKRVVTEIPEAFTVSYYSGTDTVSSKEDFRVSRGYISGRPLSLSFDLTEEKMEIIKEADLNMDVYDTSSLGSIRVYLNDQEIYDRKVGIGDVRVPLPVNMLEENNLLMIEASRPGWVLWGNNYYDIETAEVEVEYEGAFAQEFDFMLNKKEVDDFKRFRLYYSVKDYSEDLPSMMIKINNQIVYWRTPPKSLFDRDLDEDMFGDPLLLLEGENRMVFLFEENAAYTVGDVLFTVEYIK